MEIISEKELVTELIMHGITQREIAQTVHVHTSKIVEIKREMIGNGWDPRKITPYRDGETREMRLAEINKYIQGMLAGKNTNRGMSKEEYNRVLIQRKEQAKELLKQHMTLKQIAEKMNLSVSTVKKYLQDAEVQYEDPHKEQAHLPTDYITYFRTEWTAAVNRIRRYLGKEEFMEG